MNYARALRLNLDPHRPDVVAVVGGGGKSSTVFRLGLDLAAQGRRAVITHTARIAAFQVRWAPAVVTVDFDPDASTGEPEVELPLAAIAQALDAHGTCLLTGPQVGDRRLGLPPGALDQLAQHAPALGLHVLSVEADGSKMRPVKAPAAHEPVLPAATTLLCPVLGLDAIGAPLQPRWVHRPELVRSVLGLPPQDETAGADDLALTPALAARLLVDPAGGAKALPPGARLLPLLNKADTPLRLVYGRLVASLLAADSQPSVLTAAGRPATEVPATEAPGSDPVEPTKVEPAADFAAGLHGDPVRERWGPIAVVVLAAGAAQRMGRPKQVEVVDGEPMVARAVRVAAAAGLGPVYIVTGAHAERVARVFNPPSSFPPSSFPSSPLRDAPRLPAPTLLHNPAWAAGQATSVRRALDALPPTVEAALFMPVDQPFLDPVLLRGLAAAWRQGADLAAPIVDGELRGAPGLFDRTFFPALAQLEGDAGGRAILKHNPEAVARVAAQAAWLRDIDSPSDLP